MNRVRTALIVLVATIVTACGSSVPYSEADAETFDEDAAFEAASETLEDQSFEDAGDTALCTEDCGGHDAGFEWAKEQGVTDASECGGNSRSFEEGCEAYAEALEKQAYEYESEEEF